MTTILPDSDEVSDVTNGNLTVVAAIVTFLLFLLPPMPVVQIASTLGLIAVTGAFVSQRFSRSESGLLIRLLVAGGAGFFFVLALGAVVGWALPFVGVDRPLDRVPLLIVWFVVFACIAVTSYRRRRDPLGDLLRDLTRRHVVWSCVLMLPPLASLVAVTVLNAHDVAWPAIACGTVAVVLVVSAVAMPSRRRGPTRPMLLASGFLTAAWQVPFRGGWLNGWDIQHEFSVASLTIHQAVFPVVQAPGSLTDPYDGMLSLTVWPAQLHALTGMSVKTILGVIPSLFLVACLLVIWSTIRERLSDRQAAFLCVLFVVGSEPILRELPSVTRQCYALFFFALLLWSLTTRLTKVAVARAVAVMSGVGVALTHYSSAYLAAGAVATGWACSLLVRSPRATRVLAAPVTIVIVGVTVLWGSVVARTGSSISQVLDSIRADGFKFLPSSGSLVTRWLSGASISKTVNARVIHAADIKLRVTTYRWMTVDAKAVLVPLVNAPVAGARGVPVIGAVGGLAATILAELLVGAAVVSVVGCLWWSRRDRSLAAIAGVGLFALAVSLVSRLSQTAAIDFGPTRVQAQMYLVFALTASIAFARWWPEVRASRFVRPVSTRRPLVVTGLVLVVVLSVMVSTQLINLVQVKATLPAIYSNRGEGIQRIPSVEDLDAAQWLASHRATGGIVQSDMFGQLALFDFGYETRRAFFNTMDPVIVDNSSWVFANHTNILAKRARGGNNARVGVYLYPGAYFAATRSVLFSSSSDVIFGPWIGASSTSPVASAR